MSRYTPQHAAPTPRRRRFAASAGALVAGTALVLGSAGVADAKVTDPIPTGNYTLYDNCNTGFTGSLIVTKTQVTVNFDPSAAYDKGSAGIDLRGTVVEKDNNGRQRERTIRLKEEYDPLTDSYKSKTFTLPAGAYVWRVGVTAIAPGEAEDVHALDYEQGPCE
jgi:hypothetical protein